MTWPFLLLLGPIFTFFLVYKWRWRRLEKLASLLPGLPSFPFIGSAYYFVNMRDTMEYLQRLLKLENRYGTPQKFWMGHQLKIVINEVCDLETVLTTSTALDKDESYGAFAERANGIFIAKVPKWQALRKMLMTMFHKRMYDDYLKAFHKHSETLVKMLEDELGQQIFDVGPYLSRCTLDIICQTGMGVTLDNQYDKMCHIPENVERTTDLVFNRITQPWLRPDFIYFSTAAGKEMRQRCNEIKQYIKTIMAKRRQSQHGNDTEKGEVEGVIINNTQCCLDYAMQFGTENQMTDDELSQSITDLMIAGFDTTGNADSAVLLLLAMHPEEQEKVVQEQWDIFGDSDRAVTMADLVQMKQLEMVIKEVLRLYTIPLIGRRISKDIKLESYKLPAGCSILVALYFVHRNPKYWSHPNKFYPNHFTPENVASRPHYAYIPFSAGPRICPGYKYGILSMKAVLSKVLRAYHVHTDLKFDELQYKVSLMIEPINGYQIRITPRECS